jgi:hypothetical protein
MPSARNGEPYHQALIVGPPREIVNSAILGESCAKGVALLLAGGIPLVYGRGYHGNKSRFS